MTMMNDALMSLQSKAAKPVKAKPRNASKGGKGRNAARDMNVRRKRSQSDRKPSRNFKLSSGALKELRFGSGKGFVNPYREGSSYHACAAALRKLGLGRFHTFDKIVRAVLAEMGDAADAFKAKKKRSNVTGKGWEERLVQNVKVLARPDYGAKLRQIGYEVRTDTEKGAGLFKTG